MYKLLFSCCYSGLVSKIHFTRRVPISDVNADRFYQSAFYAVAHLSEGGDNTPITAILSRHKVHSEG